MSYLLPSLTTDELLMMIAAKDGKEPPEPDIPPVGKEDDPNWFYGTLRGQPRRQGPGFCFLNYTDNLHKLYPRYIYQSPYQGFVIHLTWAGWDRVQQLKAKGWTFPTEADKKAYNELAQQFSQTGIDPTTGIDINNPDIKGDLPAEPRGERVSWLKRTIAILFSKEAA